MRRIDVRLQLNVVKNCIDTIILRLHAPDLKTSSGVQIDRVLVILVFRLSLSASRS